jgi:glycosyltransferase involved in cell wall biosynthesis
VSDFLKVVILAGRLGLDDDGWPVLPLIDRLFRRRVLGRVVCVSRGNVAGGDSRVLEFPALGRRWLKLLSIRRYQLESEFEHACLLHVVHEEMAEAALALAEAWRLPYVQTVDDFAVLDRGLRLSRRWFRGLVVTSPDLAAELTGGLGVPSDRISVIPPGVPEADEAPRPSGRRIPVIGTAGLPRPESGFACFLEAARLVLDSGREAEFLIAGQGDDAIDLRRHAQSLKIADRISVADFAVVGSRLWSVLNIYCQPSLVPTTGRPLALAQAAGVPSVASGVRGLLALIDPENSGLIVAPGDPQALASALIELLDHPEDAAMMGRRGQEAARRSFDPEVEADLLASLYLRHAMQASLPGGAAT